MTSSRHRFVSLSGAIACVSIVLACGSSHRGGENLSESSSLGRTLPTTETKPDVEWKHWIDVDGDCQDTRAEVLIAESEIPVTFRTDRKCEVLTGRWTCPFTGEVVSDPGLLTVTHLVPLKSASATGGESWDQKRRQEFANELSVEAHLIVVKASINKTRDAQSPVDWLPPKNTCSYILNWIDISLHWGLTIDSDILSLHTEQCLSGTLVSGCAKAFLNRPNCTSFSGLVGEWSGKGSQSNGGSWTVRLKIGGPTGERCATIEYDDSECGGHWTCTQDRTGRSFVAREKLSHGLNRCVDNLDVHVTLNANDQLVIKWKTGDLRAKALLNRSPESP